MTQIDTNGIQMWGGLECTINRVGDQWLNQADRNGHDRRRIDDLKAFETLGISALRYPVLWEAIAPTSLREPHFELTDDSMAHLEASPVEPIVGPSWFRRMIWAARSARKPLSGKSTSRMNAAG